MFVTVMKLSLQNKNYSTYRVNVSNLFIVFIHDKVIGLPAFPDLWDNILANLHNERITVNSKDGMARGRI